MSESAPTTRWSMLIFLLVWLLSAVYLGMILNKGWVPSDEGTLGQSAQRVLNGEMPHRDFADPYTGGLAYLDAIIFRLFGINLLWLRIFMFVVFLAWVPAVYALAREFVSPWAAGGVTLAAVSWSVPNYPAAMPSWFCLFSATFGTLALARYIRRPVIQWLILAGLCGGCSFLIKSIAVYYIAAALLFFVYREQSLSRNQIAAPRRTPLYLAFLSLCISIFVFALIKLVYRIGGVPEYLHFVFPGLAMALLLAARERVPPVVSSGSRFQSLFRMAAPFLLAAALPVGLFFIFYWHRGALPALMNGLFVAAFRRVLHAVQGPLALILEYPSVLVALLLMEAAKLRGLPRRCLSVFLVLLSVVVLLSSRREEISFIIALASALGIIPVIVAAAMFQLWDGRQVPNSSLKNDQQLILLVTMTALLSLIQFPYYTPIYFCYSAPLTCLLSAALISRLPRPPRIILHGAVAFYILFAIFVLRPHFAGSRDFQSDYGSTPLMLQPAGQLRVSRESAAEYRELIPLVKNLAGGNPILAGPDCPEVYFLADIGNPTPVEFDFLLEPHDYEREMKSVIERSNFIKVAVINDAPPFSFDQLLVLRSLVSTQFPHSRRIGKFTVYWRS